MFLAGLDEAGYGPLVGPLVVGWSLFRVPRPDFDLWEALAEAATPKPPRGTTRRERRLWVDDSKRVHSGPRGRARLERSVAAFRELIAPGDPSLSAWVSEAPAPPRRFFHRAPWFTRLDGSLCPSAEGDRARLDASQLRRGLERAGASLDGFGARPAHAAEWNRLCADHGKAGALFQIDLEALREVLDRTADAPLRIECDRLGSRRRYAAMLARGLGPERVETHAEEAHASLYTLHFPHRRVEIRFREEADRLSFPVALASLAAKQTRERLMELWNAWFSARLPGIRPTKGYALDAKRWLEEALPRLPDLGITDPRWVRRLR